MQELILHSFRRCPFAIRVRMALEEKNLAYTVFEEDLSAPSEKLLKLHPEGKVPLLIHGSHVIHESSIITEYLEDSFPEPALMPQNAGARAQIRLWTYWCNHIFKPDLDAFKYESKELSQQAQDELHARLAAHLQKMTVALGSSPYFMGEVLTLADIHVFPFYRQLQKSHANFSNMFETKTLDEWLLRITSRESFARVMKK